MTRSETAGLLVTGQQIDPTLVTIGLTPLRGQERFDDLFGIFDRMHPGANAHHLGVVVLASQLGRFDAPRQRATDAFDLVRGDLFAVARATDHDAKGAGLVRDRLGGGHAERRLVVLGVVFVSTVVDWLVAVLSQPGDQVGFEFEAGVVSTEMYAHTVIVSGRAC